MTNYTFTMPVGAVAADILFAAVPATLPQPDSYAVSYAKSYQTPDLILTYTNPLTPAQVTAMTTLVATNPHPANTPWLVNVTLTARAQSALAANATYQALANPSTAQAIAQVASLTKQANGIIRLLLNQLDSTTGT